MLENLDERLEKKILTDTELNLRTKYGNIIAEYKRGTRKSISIKHSDITNNTLADFIVYRKGYADRLIRQALLNVGLTEKEIENIQIRYTDLPSLSTISSLRSDLVGQTRSFDGIVRRVSEVKSKATIAVFECSKCGARTHRDQDVPTIPEPYCEQCRKPAKWKVIPELGKYIDYQLFTIQENPESVKSGDQPKSINVSVTGDICGTIIPGTRVTVCGVLKLKQIKNEDELLFQTYVEGSSITIKEENYDNITISESDLRKIEELSKSETLLEDIAGSIAPTVFGNDEIKRGISLALFGGVPKQIGRTRIRGDIHAILVGDPGTAKSVIIKYAADMSPRGIFTQATSSSKAGLTATAIKVNDEWVLEAGALVLADKGVCAVDELDKMGEIDRDSLHGAMEQQELDIAKAGIVAKLFTRCSLLAAANPKLGRFDSYKPLPPQFDLPPSLMSRFDLIYVIEDKPEEVRDGEIADHILSTHTSQKVRQTIHPDLLKKYIAHGKTFNPRLTKESVTILKEYYTKVRRMASNMDTVPITARSLEALVRLSEAAARMRLSNTVDPDDAKLVVSIVDGCLSKIAYDSTTKTWDIDRVMTRYPKRVRDVYSKLTDTIIFVGDESGAAKVDTVKKHMFEKYGISDEEVDSTIETFVDQRKLYTPRTGLVKILR